MRISDWSSDVCSSDLDHQLGLVVHTFLGHAAEVTQRLVVQLNEGGGIQGFEGKAHIHQARARQYEHHEVHGTLLPFNEYAAQFARINLALNAGRSEEHTSELQSLMRNSYAVFCLKKKKQNRNIHS